MIRSNITIAKKKKCCLALKCLAFKRRSNTRKANMCVLLHLPYHRYTSISVYVITISVGKTLEKPTTQHFPSLLLIKSYAYRFNPRMIKVNEENSRLIQWAVDQFQTASCYSILFLLDQKHSNSVKVKRTPYEATDFISPLRSEF